MRLGLTFSILAAASTFAGSALAQPLLDASGRVALLDGAVPSGVRVTLGLDLDRDGTLNSFETLQANVGSDGSYQVRYTPDPTNVDFEFVQFVAELAVDYQARGFEAVLDDGPLPVVLRFEREGYSTIVKRFTTFSDLPSLDVVLAPLSDLHCNGTTCMSPDGAVQVSGFPGGTGIARAYARASDPGDNTRRFPGVFADRSENLLLSSGFTEIDLRDESGDPVTALSRPVSVRFEARRNSWHALRDLTPDSGRIEVPMYSFDEDRADWVSESPGELNDADGQPLDESELETLHDGTHEGPVFIAFETSHFSSFNCDAPVGRRACVKGRLVVSGQAVAGVQVSVNGVNYTGTAGTVFTGADGTFASDLMKSEEAGEDVDGNGRAGEMFEASINASGAIGVFVGDPFTSPTEQGTIGAGSRTCTPSACDCFDLGDIDGDFEPPRPCEVTVTATFSGVHVVGSGGPLDAGDPVVSAKVTGELTGGINLPLDDTVCGDLPCNSGQADDGGGVSFVVPVVGSDPTLEISAEYSTERDGELHYYRGSVTVAGCVEGESSLGGSVDLSLSHAALGNLGAYITSLGSGPPVPTDGGLADLLKPPEPPKCGCIVVGVRTPGGGWLALAAAILGSLCLRRRRLR